MWRGLFIVGIALAQPIKIHFLLFCWNIIIHYKIINLRVAKYNDKCTSAEKTSNPKTFPGLLIQCESLSLSLTWNVIQSVFNEIKSFGDKWLIKFFFLRMKKGDHT